MTYDIGDQARIAVTFTNIAGTATDPTAISLTVVTPGRASQTYTYAAAEITRDAVGTYHKDVTLTEHGTWSFRWQATGDLVAAEEGSLFVRRKRT